ncbi:CBS domain-containing protein [Streptomyces sp. NPDC048425]|uniref:CBS domain-containing protein n=1 Tax=Streptomyces sp. NPDC048425 TaxID=3365548 RepID=UPI00371382B8
MEAAVWLLRRPSTPRAAFALPVIEGEGRVVGVVSEADLPTREELRDDPDAAYLQLRQPVDVAKADALSAGDLMSSPPSRSAPTLAEAARTMAQEGVKRLPVVDEVGLLAGVVSRADLLKVFLRGDDKIAEEVRHDIVSRLFPPPTSTIHVEVHDGVATLRGLIHDTSLVPIAARLVRSVEGVVDVRFDLACQTA